MKTEFSEGDFSNQTLQCPKCGWTGKGDKANVIDFYGVVSDKEIHCPECDKSIGILKRGSSNNPPGESATDLSFQLG